MAKIKKDKKDSFKKIDKKFIDKSLKELKVTKKIITQEEETDTSLN